MTETPFFFRRDAAQLYGLVHSPAPEVAAQPLAFLFSHPFAEEKLWSHRVMVSLARELAARGHVVMRFDYMGAGDSTGSTPDTSLQTHLADLTAAFEHLIKQHPQVQRVGLLGLRFGATLAALFAEQSAAKYPQLQAAPLVLWEPVLDGANYFQELLRINLGTQLAVYGKVLENRDLLQEQIRAGGKVNVDGYEIARDLFESCARPDLLNTEPKSHSGPTLVLQIAPGADPKPRDELTALSAAYRSGSVARVAEQPFWREIKPFYGRATQLQQATLQWLEQAHV
ncbi:serine aminopeptidase domain-containing protein [Steroidobacter sp.]|uniref:serine aminopeptidase domain-containing protein n=1 Tax=Steroidobacter sp. TaxID=1978227 RepID=UPI001A4A39F9|nr:alpha/beta hydrolase [Steroidobacter sp.]MBL8269752.1 alpha/beta hydrolase [Steroidobacter sp.]